MSDGRVCDVCTEFVPYTEWADHWKERHPEAHGRRVLVDIFNRLTPLSTAALRVLSYWDYMDAVPSDDERPNEFFKEEMDRRMNELRTALDIPGGAAPTPTRE